MSFKVYFDELSYGFYQTDIHKVIPEGAIQVSDKKRLELLEGQSGLKKIALVGGDVVLVDRVIDVITIRKEEVFWRDSELVLADYELNKVQDSDNKAVGTVSQWRDYRKSLRAWPEHKDFPNKESRPVSPLIKE